MSINPYAAETSNAQGDKSILSLYREIALGQVPRILGLCDRDPDSRTFGCGDRYYWHYRLLDLPNARFQEVSWLTALLYSLPFDERYYQNSSVLVWTEGMIRFWLGNRNGDGSVNEVYPFERSFCATSFSTLAVTESLLLLKPALPPEIFSGFIHQLAKTGRWLADHDNVEVMNQQAASLVALQNLATLTGSGELVQAARRKRESILQAQAEAGFFPEYGGMDIGYLSITLGLLALYAQKAHDVDMEVACRKAAGFLEPLIDNQGHYDYSQTSRRTQYLYPSGFHRYSPEILESHARGLKANTVLNPQWMDDRYCIALTVDYLLLAAQEYSDGGPPQC